VGVGNIFKWVIRQGRTASRVAASFMAMVGVVVHPNIFSSVLDKSQK
jgi:hypothetical protein